MGEQLQTAVLAKLMSARVALSKLNLKKSGQNTFSKYKYYELADFLPSVMEIFGQTGLAGVVSFGHDLATLTITCVGDGSSITITSPMSTADLKGCHPIQNLGACQTYLRRYLWTAAMELTEHDVLDAVTDTSKSLEPAKEAPKQKKRTASQAVNDLVIASNGDVELAKQRAKTVTGKEHSKEYTDLDIVALDKYTATLISTEDVPI